MCYWGSRYQQLCHQNIHGSYTHTQRRAHAKTFIFFIHAVHPTETAVNVSQIPLSNHLISFGVLRGQIPQGCYFTVQKKQAVRGNVPDHFKAGLLLLDDFIPFKSQERGRMNGKEPYSRKVDLGKP